VHCWRVRKLTSCTFERPSKDIFQAYTSYSVFIVTFFGCICIFLVLLLHGAQLIPIREGYIPSILQVVSVVVMHLAITAIAPEGRVGRSIFVIMSNPFCFLTTFVVWVADAAMSARPFCLCISSAASVTCTHLLAAQTSNAFLHVVRGIQQQTFHSMLTLCSNRQDKCSLTLQGFV